MSPRPENPEARAPENQSQVVVIGAGVVGASVALALARRGIRTTVESRPGSSLFRPAGRGDCRAPEAWVSKCDTILFALGGIPLPGCTLRA